MFTDFRDAAADVWDHRDLLEQLTLRDIRIRYKQAVMGYAWAVLMPCLVVSSGLVVRYAMAQLSGTRLVETEMAGIAVKGIAWAFFVGTLGFASTALIGNSNLVSKVFFPREVLPLAAIATQMFDTAIGLGTLVLVLPFMGVRLHASLLWVPVLLLLLLLMTVALSLFLSSANLFFRDVKYIVQVVLMFGVFFSPVFFEPSMLGARGATIMMLNPLTGILEGLRVSVVEGHNLFHPLSVIIKGSPRPAWEPWALTYSALWAIGGTIGAGTFFRRLQPLFAEFI